jgi:prephenate dehydrogenase
MSKAQDQFTEIHEPLTFPDPLELIGIEFKRVAIIGVGLIGGSIGLRMKAMGYPGTIIGYDYQETLDEAVMRGAIDIGVGDISEAVLDSDLIILALPYDETQKLLPTIIKTAKQNAIVTDTCGTKAALVNLALKTEGARADFIGGHPLAGSNRQGIANADADLFVNGYYVLVPSKKSLPGHVESLKWWVRSLGAYPMVLEPALHDQVMASTTHVPLMIAIALTNWLAQASKEQPLLQKLAIGHFLTMTTITALPLEVWESVLKTNVKEVLPALKAFREVLEKCEKDLKAGRLDEIWQTGHSFQRSLSREKPGDWESQCELIVIAPDRSGTIANITSLLADNDINIRDIAVLYLREHMGGRLRVVVATKAEAKRAVEILTIHGYSARLKD